MMLHLLKYKAKSIPNGLQVILQSKKYSYQRQSFQLYAVQGMNSQRNKIKASTFLLPTSKGLAVNLSQYSNVLHGCRVCYGDFYRTAKVKMKAEEDYWSQR